jgi:hypothetical protein
MVRCFCIARWETIRPAYDPSPYLTEDSLCAGWRKAARLVRRRALDRRRGAVHGRTGSVGPARRPRFFGRALTRGPAARARAGALGHYLTRRSLHSLVSLLGLIILVFFLARLTGDPTNL